MPNITLSIVGVNPRATFNFKNLFLILIIFISGTLTLMWIQFRNKVFTEPFWDLKVYMDAAKSGLSYEQIYRDSQNKLNFIYHPYVQFIFSALNELISLDVILKVATVISIIFFIYQYSTFLNLEPSWFKFTKLLNWLIVPLGTTMLLGGAPLIAVASGNIAVLLHSTVCGTFFLNHRKPSRIHLLTFMFALAIAATIKPIFLFYLTLLLLTYSVPKALKISSLVAALFSLIWFSCLYTMPQAYKSFTTALINATVKKGDLGFSLFAIFQDNLGITPALIIHLIVPLFLFCLIYYLSKKAHQPVRTIAIKVAPVFFTILVTVNPRMKEYDFFIAILITMIWLKTELKWHFLPFISIFFAFFLTRFLVLEVSSFLLFKIPDVLTYLRYWELLSLVLLQFSVLSIHQSNYEKN